MTSQNTSPQMHASVLQFLINNGYMESAEAFKREARRYLDILPASQVSEEQLANDMTRLQLQRYAYIDIYKYIFFKKIVTEKIYYL